MILSMKKILPIILIFLAVPLYAQEALELIGRRMISVPEPSSLFLKDNFLWTVSDEDGCLYKLTRSGAVRMTYHLGLADRESVYISDDGRFYLADEASSDVMVLDSHRKLLKKYSMDLGEVSKNSGAEGLTYSPDSGHFYVVKEKKPAEIIEFDSEFNKLAVYDGSFAKDLSDIFYDRVNRVFWVLSHKSNSVFIWTPDDGVKNVYAFDIVQAEGLTIDFDRNLIYIVSDKDNQMYTFQIPAAYSALK